MLIKISCIAHCRKETIEHWAISCTLEFLRKAKSRPFKMWNIIFNNLLKKRGRLERTWMKVVTIMEGRT